MQESYINVDESVEWKNYPIAQVCINHLVHHEVPWLSEKFIDDFMGKYQGIDINSLDEISLLMYETKKKFDEKALYDIAIESFFLYETFYARVYLLQKVLSYCDSYIYPIQLFTKLKKYAQDSNDFRLLADSLKSIYDKFASNILDITLLDEIQSYLKKSEKLLNNDYDRVNLAFSLQRNGFEKDAQDSFELAYKHLSSSIDKKKIQINDIKVLLARVHDEDELLFKREELCLEWQLKLAELGIAK